ncbi:response regulator transcription factor [Microbacterium sp.]|uniref:helix-turn-helix transcriptional regulator n=1 Tax=Microbacterium sp. TaxID=51671 RepID=UPI003F97427E
MTTALQDELPVQARTTDERELVSQVAADLLTEGLPTAPHVVAKLLRRLNADAGTARETAAQISPLQRSGQRMLPKPLPLVPSISAAFEQLDLDADDRFVLLLAALCTDNKLDLLVDASQRSPLSLLTGPVGEHLAISHGRYRFIDARMAIWVRETVAGLDTTRAHARLLRVHEKRDDRVRAAWHQARGAVEREADLAPMLTSMARELNVAGSPESAFEVAVEAADHATGAARDEACLMAGVSAVAAGCFDDAAKWLRGLFPHGDRACRRRALTSMLIAETCARGAVPVLDPAELRPTAVDTRQWFFWARTAGIAAVMCAERGDVPAMRVWLTELRDADRRADAGGAIQESAVAMCWMLTGDADAVPMRSRGPYSGGVVGALSAAVDGDIAGGLQMLARARSGLVDETDPLVSGFERSPLVDAYLAVTETLLHFWRGDVDAARERLSTASIDLPVAVPFAGLGTVLAHRLDITALGAPGVLPQVLSETLPSGMRIDRLVDHGLRAYLDGAHEQAATDLRLWHDRGAPELALSVPGLDEVGPVIVRTRIEPPELTEATALRHRIRAIPETSWRRERDAIADAGRSLSSSFCRGRVEAMLATVSIVHEDLAGGRRHLRAARSLFEDSGALAWRDVIDMRLDRLMAQMQAMSGIATAPIHVVGVTDPLQNSRVAWSEILTDRELEVAMRVAEGLTNSEIAGELDISVRTVEVHVSKLFSVLGVRNRVELTVLAHRTGQHL